MTASEQWTLAVQGLAAFGALVLAVLAIWGEWVRSILAAPKLNAALRSEHGELTYFGDDRPVRYYHLVVRNSRPWAPARNVIAFLTRVERPGPDGQWQQALRTGPLVLPWQFGKFVPRLPLIGREHICDLGRVSEETGFELVPEFRPNNFDPTLPGPGKLRAHVNAIADNGDSKAIVIEFAWDGKWVEGANEMRTHLVVKEVKETS